MVSLGWAAKEKYGGDKPALERHFWQLFLEAGRRKRPLFFKSDNHTLGLGLMKLWDIPIINNRDDRGPLFWKCIGPGKVIAPSRACPASFTIITWTHQEMCFICKLLWCDVLNTRPQSSRFVSTICSKLLASIKFQFSNKAGNILYFWEEDKNKQ